MTEFTVGDPAPDFSLETDTSGRFTLSHHIGRRVVIFFYPADNTPGCTKQNCEFTALKPEFDALNTLLVGISPNGLADHAKFRTKYGLEATLAADPEHVAIALYDVWGEKKLAGRAYMGLIRTTFLIDETGKIAEKWVVARTKGHAAKVLARLKNLST